MTAELCVRSLSADAQPLLDRTIEALARAVEVGALEEYELVVTGEAFDPSAAAARTGTGRSLATRVANIRDWADRVDATVSPYFQHESVDSPLTDETFTRVRFPTICLEEFHDGQLAFVAPARIDGEHIDVPDRLETLVAARSGPELSPLPD